MKSNNGFTLFEIMIVVAIIATMMAVFSLRLGQRSPEKEWPNIVETINDLVAVARQEAMSQQKTYRVVFDAEQEQHAITIEESGKNPEKPGQVIYNKASSFYADTEYVLPAQCLIRAVYLGKQEQLENNKNKGYCLISSDGLVQDITVHLVKIKEETHEEVGITLTMLPFYGYFEYDQGLERPR